MPSLSTSDWIAVIGIIIATIFAIIGFIKIKNGNKNKINIIQKSGALSKGDQDQKVSITNTND